MAITNRERWDLRHTTRRAPDKPSGFLRDIIDNPAWTIQRGRALDIATGKGRNAFFLAALGFDVDAIDISAVALEEARERATALTLSISWRQMDLEQLELPERCYDLIVNFNYLQRSLVPQIKKALKSGGVAIFETYLIDQRNIGHPSNPAYLLGHNELLELFRDLRVLYYREGKFVEDGEEAFRAGILAQRVG
jgi:SAM-dependent methyltransferase